MVGKKGTLIIILGIAGLLLIGGLVVIAALQSKDFLIVRSPLLIRETPLVTFVEGDCFHRDNPEGEWIEAKVGDKILRGYQIRTQRSAKVDIRLYKDTVVRITEDSLLTLDELTLKKLTLNLAEGQLYGRFHRIFKDQSLNIRTPTTVAAVRGTQLAFEIRGEGEDLSTDVASLSGITEVINPSFPDQPVLLSLQNKTRIGKNSPPAAPTAVGLTEFIRLTNIINAINEEQVLLITNRIQFAPNTADFTAESIPELENVAKLLKALRKKQILITGHTAAVGSPDAMYRLSVARAQRVKDFLIENEIAASRLEIKGFGGEKPVADNESADGRARNRRVEFHIIE